MNAMATKSSEDTQFTKIYKKMLSWDLPKLTKMFFVFGLALLVGTSYTWYNHLYIDDERRFWNAIENSLATKSVVRSLTEGGSGNEAIRSQQFAFSPHMAARSRVSVQERSATQQRTAITEGVSFIDSSYFRYVTYRESPEQVSEDGTPMNLDDILGQWEGATFTGEEAEQARLAYMGELVSLVVFGNFDADYRRDLTKRMKQQNAYSIDLNNVRDQQIGEDEEVWAYPVRVNLKVFAGLYRDALIHSGYGDFPVLDPENYQEDSQVSVTILVSKKSGAVTGLDFGNRRERYSRYGVALNIEPPETTFERGGLEQAATERLSLDQEPQPQ